ncbi:MAG: hypothetical protein SPE37_03645, partial [Campylobacter sp.]|nr:hypothetical protein [Campylobacter sp.]
IVFTSFASLSLALFTLGASGYIFASKDILRFLTKVIAVTANAVSFHFSIKLKPKGAHSAEC